MQGEKSNEELSALIVGGGSAAREAEVALCRRFALSIRLYGLRHLRNEDRARDLVQAVLLAVLEAVRAGSVEDPKRLDRFVLGTCRNVTLRMRQIEARAESVDDEELAKAMAPEREIVATGALLRCLDVLDLRAQQILRLTFVEERSVEEIAAALVLTPGNVRVIRHRALAALRSCLGEHQEVEP